jgi:inner membrane protein
METIVQNVWNKSKLLIKGLIIALLILLLQIPAYYVKGLIEEREQRQQQAITEVSSKWAGRQNIAGPVLVVPYLKYDSDTLIVKSKARHLAYFLPDELTVHSTITPQEKYRGIYKVMLYTSGVHLSGLFNEIHPEKLGIATEDILWKDAYIKFNISDTKGLNDELKVNWNNKILGLSPPQNNDDGLTASVGINSAEELKNVHFSADINVSGSEQLLFTPVGKTTTVTLDSKWPHPSFIGAILPQATQIKDSGFSATWKSLAYKRSFPQEWKDDAYLLTNQNDSSSKLNNIQTASFGADLFVPVNGYQKTSRSVKYAVFCILLTFASFFLIETTQKKSIHPFQYCLIGLALILFYTLLLSFSEYIGFNVSYVIASVFTIALIVWFAKGILDATRPATILAVVLVLLYTYIFTILQLQDYSLLLGSLGLFLTLGVVMHFSKKIQW